MQPESRERTLQDVVPALEARGPRRLAVGLHSDLGLRWWTCARLVREIRTVAGLLRDRGIGRGDAVVLWGPNAPEWVAAFFGVVTRGAFSILVDSDVDPKTVAAIAARERARIVLCRRVPGGLATDDGATWVPLTPAAGTQPPAIEDVLVRVGPEDPAALLSSSGTTATPKGVLLSHRNVMCQVEPFLWWRQILRWLPFRMLVLPPASHVLGLVVGLVLPLMIGLGIVYTAGTRAVTWARVIRDHRIALALAVPRVLDVLERHVRSTPLGRRRLALDARLARAGLFGRLWWPIWARGEVFGRPLFRLFLVGGAHLPPQAVRFWRSTAVLVVHGYGLAETAGIVSFSNPFSPSLGDVGRPSGVHEVKLAPDGEILVRGPHVAAGSRGAGEASGMDADGFLATGDLGRFVRGRLHIVGRKKDVIVTAEGFNVHPDAVEAAMARQAGVLDCAVVGRAGSTGEEVHAVLQLEPGIDPVPVLRAANAELADHERVRSWTRWPMHEAIPRNRMGKVLRAEVIARVLDPPVDRDPMSVARAIVTAADLIGEGDRRRRLDLVARYLVQNVTTGDDSSLRLDGDLGLTSLDIVELLARVDVLQEAGAGAPAVAADMTLAGLQAAIHSHRISGADDAFVPRGPARISRLLGLVRPITRAAAISAWTALNTMTETHWEDGAPQIAPPFFIAAAPHRHWLDSFIVHRALPRRLRRRLHLLVEHEFSEHFRPSPRTPLRSRLLVACAYYVGLPALFPFTVLTPYGRTREGLIDAARRIDRGRIVLSFPKGLAYFGNPQPDRHALGIARLAIETGRPILPVHLHSRGVSLGWRWRRPRQRVGVWVGAPVWPAAHAVPEDVAAQVESAFARLREAASRVSRPA